MSAATTIEWTDATWNPVRGCSRKSPGCGGPNHQGGCYAERIAARFSDPGQPFHGFAERTEHGGRWTGRMALVDDKLDEPLHWRRPRRIFVNSMSDLFHEALPDAAIDRVFGIMARAPQHTFQVLTKRAQRMRDFMTTLGAQPERIGCHDPVDRRSAERLKPFVLPNVWLGVSTERQVEAEERIPLLLETPAAKRFVSAEPLLGPLELHHLKTWRGLILDALAGEHWYPGAGSINSRTFRNLPRLDWIIAGGESGPRSRPNHPDWFRALRDQCRRAGVPFFFKQWGDWLPVGQHLPDHGKIHGATAVKPGRMKLHYGGTPQRHPDHAFAERGVEFASTRDGRLTFRVGKKAAGASLDGREWREFPA